MHCEPVSDWLDQSRLVGKINKFHKALQNKSAPMIRIRYFGLFFQSIGVCTSQVCLVDVRLSRCQENPAGDR